MLTQEITYTDFDGNECTENFYFHMSVNQLTELQLSKDEGFDEYLRKIVAEENTRELFTTIKDLIFRSYGVRDESGKKFIQSEELSSDFMNSPAFDSLLLTLMGDANFASSFIRGIVPDAEKLGLTDEKIAEEMKAIEERKKE